MLILPAVDLKDRVAVRLLRGDFDEATDYGDPAAALSRFAAAGACWAHVVDLDGARAGEPVQIDLVRRLATTTTLSLQVGGGARSRADVAALLDAGASRVVIGSLAVRRPDEALSIIDAHGAERVCAAFDVRRAGARWEVSVDGWSASSGKSLLDVLSDYPPGTLRHVLATDIERDGALVGSNADLTKLIAAARPDLAVQASGGVAALEDIGAQRAAGAAAVIVGRALYERRFTLEEALAV